MFYKILNYPRELIVVRHGQSIQNIHAEQEIAFPGIVEKISGFFGEKTAWGFTNLIDFLRGKKTHIGIKDEEIPLTELGKKQALLTAEQIIQKGLIPDVLICSSLRRARETAQIIQGHVNKITDQKIQLVEYAFLREKEEGVNDGVPRTYLRYLKPLETAEFKQLGHLYYRPAGGENVLDVYARVSENLSITLQHYAGLKVMLVAHGMTNMCIDNFLTGTDIKIALAEKYYRMPNLAVTKYFYADSSWQKDQAFDRVVLF